MHFLPPYLPLSSAAKLAGPIRHCCTYSPIRQQLTPRPGCPPSQALLLSMSDMEEGEIEADALVAGKPCSVRWRCAQPAGARMPSDHPHVGSCCRARRARGPCSGPGHAPRAAKARGPSGAGAGSHAGRQARRRRCLPPLPPRLPAGGRPLPCYRHKACRLPVRCLLHVPLRVSCRAPYFADPDSQGFKGRSAGGGGGKKKRKKAAAAAAGFVDVYGQGVSWRAACWAAVLTSALPLVGWDWSGVCG